ncbi:MAG: hypothetical protein AAF805_08075 [Planctomycetota bacterium]
MRRVALRLTAALTVIAAADASLGAGYFNMPTSFAQCLGLGWGPGYHAPLLLGPAVKARIATQDVRRLPAPLGPPPSSMGVGHASVMPPHPPMTPAAAWHAAPPAVSRPIFAGPTLAPAGYAPAPSAAEAVPAERR